MRVAMLAHSTNPRGGVVHAMALSEALAGLGVDVMLHAPDANGRGFFRKVRVDAKPFRVDPAPADFAAMIETRIGDYVRWFEPRERRGFDVFHAHDGISGNALVELKRRGMIGRFARTVHHIDDFSDPKVAAWQRRSIEEADEILVVSAFWRERVASEFGRNATLGGNGVDLDRYTADAPQREAALRLKYELGDGPVFLSLGGVEERKNTVRTLIAFGRWLTNCPDAWLLIAGGATLLDHSRYQASFRDEMRRLGPAAKRVRLVGPVADDDMPALYSLADVYLSASIKEGFGLCVIEALASGRPVVVSDIEPFNAHLGADEVLWCDPSSPPSIAAAMGEALGAERRAAAKTLGPRIASRFPWSRVAERHLPVYQHLRASIHA